MMHEAAGRWPVAAGAAGARAALWPDVACSSSPSKGGGAGAAPGNMHSASPAVAGHAESSYLHRYIYDQHLHGYIYDQHLHRYIYNHHLRLHIRGATIHRRILPPVPEP